MGITARQGEILNRIITEYIRLAQPISSQLLERKYNFGICPATVRIEMQKLADQGYIYQPYTSAGRVPTDKGYRFFVDELLEKRLNKRTKSEFFKIDNWFQAEVEDDIKFFQDLTKNLAHFSGVLALSYFEKEKIFWKEGWEEILKEPEFEEKNILLSFLKFLEDFEKNIENLKLNSGIKIYIGRENPFKKAKDFSIISLKCCLADEETIISLLGPKRMAYERNISLMNSLRKLLEKS